MPPSFWDHLLLPPDLQISVYMYLHVFRLETHSQSKLLSTDIDNKEVAICLFYGEHVNQRSGFCFSCGRPLAFLKTMDLTEGANMLDQVTRNSTTRPPVAHPITSMSISDLVLSMWWDWRKLCKLFWLKSSNSWKHKRATHTCAADLIGRWTLTDFIILVQQSASKQLKHDS